MRPIGRAPYAVAALCLCGVKLSVDRIVTESAFHRTWSPTMYWIPLGHAARLGALTATDRNYLLALAAISLPFVAAGTWLTLARLRSVGRSPWFVFLFFVPIANIALFVALALVPGRASAADRAASQPPAWRRWLPSSTFGAASVATIAVGIIGAAFVVLETRVTVDYGWGMFVALPFAQGLLAVWFTGARNAKAPSIGMSIAVAMLSLAISGVLLAAFLVEGLVCLAMAAPLAIVLVLIGALVGRAVLTIPPRRGGPAVAAFALLPLVLFGAAPSATLQAPRYAVTTRIVVDAPPERVWPQVVAFPPLPAPTEPIFLAGIAYPQRAHIVGSGRGAVRYCEFSTGAFVEPITTWEAPHRLAFGVSRNPPALRELALWGGSFETAHVANYLVADAGEFRLERLPGGRTELIGTTWYRHNLYPAAYWRLWSDAIIHRIHLRVLNHIARVSTE